MELDELGLASGTLDVLDADLVSAVLAPDLLDHFDADSSLVRCGRGCTGSVGLGGNWVCLEECRENEEFSSIGREGNLDALLESTHSKSKILCKPKPTIFKEIDPSPYYHPLNKIQISKLFSLKHQINHQNPNPPSLKSKSNLPLCAHGSARKYVGRSVIPAFLEGYANLSRASAHTAGEEHFCGVGDLVS